MKKKKLIISGFGLVAQKSGGMKISPALPRWARYGHPQSGGQWGKSVAPVSCY